MKQSLSLLENAADSFNEALRKVRDASYGDPRPYKFAVLHFTHAIELLFKHHVALAHPLLIYRNPFSKSLEKEATIGLWEAVQFFKNEQKELTTEALDDLKWIKSLRNNIEHYKFEMDLREARRAIGRLIRAINEFHGDNGFTELATLIEQDCRDTYEKLADEYKQALFEAQQSAAAVAGDHEPQSCFHCGNSKTVVQSANSLLCQLCGGESLLQECLRCGETYPDDLMRVWNDEHGPGEEDWMCDFCYDHIHDHD
jgi:hypothetical protein